MSEKQGPEYYNRYTGRIEHESVYGEAWLDWAYNSRLGRLTVELAAKRLWFSRWYGWRMSRRSSAKKIVPFIQKYGLDIAEMQLPPDHFATFNDFFYRRLKPEARPIHADADTVVFPADGRHLGFANVTATDQFYAKGQRMSLAKLLDDPVWVQRYTGGSLVISRLCPVDYHRFHYPAEGVPGDTRLINGDLYSVNPVCLRNRLSALWENKRALTSLHTERFGQVLCLEIGATCVGSIIQTHVPGQYTPKGGEKGYFAFGGSMCMTLFEPGAVTLAEDLLEHSAAGRELYAHMGDRLGQAN
jgi:phosphatidylserine decarboxylase